MAPAYSVVSDAQSPAAAQVPPDVAEQECEAGTSPSAWRVDGPRAAAAGLLALCLLAGSAYFAEVGQTTGTAVGGQRLRSSALDLFEAHHRTMEDGRCDPFDIDSDWDFTNTKPISSIDDIDSPEDCQQECQNMAGCGVWTFGKLEHVKGLTKTCFLKEMIPGAVVHKIRRYGVTSGIMAGIPCEAATPDEKKPKKILGIVKVRDGLCLEVENASKLFSEVHMANCIVDSTSQIWVYSQNLGQLKNEAGLCLGADHWSQDFAGLRMHRCDAGNWSQQWTFDRVSGLLKIWRGNCLESGEPGVDGGMLYMQACDINASSQQWDIGDPNEIITDDTVSSMRHFVPGSLFCYALMMPGGYEQELLTDQNKRGVGMFDCDDWMIYSNKVIQIGHKNTSVIDSDLKCKMGGEFGTALNLDIFIILWSKVARDELYLQHNWTVKADPDAVFFPLRLRSILTIHSEVPEGSYINNCKYGLHGPIEVFSRNAVTAWSNGWRTCKQYFDDQCGGDCFWGEDLFIDQCLWKVLKVRRENDFRLLLEDHCEPPPGWEKCTDEVVAAFHPYKNVSAWNTCLNAGRGDSAKGSVDLLPASEGEEEGSSDADAEDRWGSPSGNRCPEGCHTAQPGEACYKAVKWARTVGVVDHPEWYPTLSRDSTWEEFQSVLEQGASDEVGCKPPCGPCDDADGDAEDGEAVHAYEDDLSEAAANANEYYDDEDDVASVEPLTAKAEEMTG